ncbi:MAG: type I DNA topoisomerase [Defluviitaleaceae bacterium]|nr:type I DNA topoisomerase [Defluviitaleaceae bacterium]
MKRKLVIVESPAKAKTLKKFLGSGYKIEACVGHVRDLPKSQLGISIEDDYEPKYITIRGKGKLLAKLRKEAKNSDVVYLATDPDREGEAISWHLISALNLDEGKTTRITFNEITKKAVIRAVKEARRIDMNLVDAQQARRELDRIVGYKISPLLWKKVKKGLSAGRVQSVALKMICDREEEVESFIPVEYWSIEAALKVKKSAFTAKFTGDVSGKIELSSKAQCDEILAKLQGAKFKVTEVRKGTRTRKPPAPFITSTLQQEASKHLGYAAQKTMMVAQQLYEGVETGQGTVGLITYMRTDSTRISDEGFDSLKAFILQNFGEDYANETKVEYKTKRAGQDAHEAIRPTDVGLTPDSLKPYLSAECHKLYKLIWERYVASQMKPALFDTVSASIEAGGYVFRASGSLLRFDGFQRVYTRLEDEEKSGVKIPELQEGETLSSEKIDASQHFTQPPPRYSEALLVKTMEDLGIGRPSTYAATISTIVKRRYVAKQDKVFYPTELGEIVNDIMKNNFEDIVDIDFTAKMEEDLDKVEDGEIFWKEVIRRFYPGFKEKIELAEARVGEVEIVDEVTEHICEGCGRNMVIKYGRFGKFLACPGFPECRNTKPFFEEAGVDCPICSAKVLIKKSKNGRKYFGCENNPECAFMSWSKPTGQKCPSCGDVLVEKGRKPTRIVCVSEKCGYSEVKKEADDDE